MQVAGKGRLSDAELLLSEAAAQFFLVAHAALGDEAEDLTVAKCLGGAHMYILFNRLYIYTGKEMGVKHVFEIISK